MILESVRKNKISSFFIVSLFIIIIMVGVYCVCMYMDLGVISLPISLAAAIIPAIISYYNCDKMVLALNGARPATREQDLQLSVILENLCIASGLPMPKLYVIDDMSPNAFATGRNPENAVICVTTGLLAKLNKYELEGVIAHELSHIKNYDILLSTIVSVFVGFVVILSDWFTRYALWGGSRRRSRDNDSNSGNAIIAIIAILFLILSPIFATLMKLAISRKREYLADASAVEMTRNPDGLIDALIKISDDPDVLEAANKSTAHMYISNPLKEKKSDLWSTHPDTAKRIEALRNIK